MLLGVMDGQSSVGTVTNFTVSNQLLGRYVQDDWRPTKNLTLNLGLRYEMQTPYTYRHNAGSIFNPNVVNPISYAVGKADYGRACSFSAPAIATSTTPTRQYRSPAWLLVSTDTTGQ